MLSKEFDTNGVCCWKIISDDEGGAMKQCYCYQVDVQLFFEEHILLFLHVPYKYVYHCEKQADSCNHSRTFTSLSLTYLKIP